MPVSGTTNGHHPAACAVIPDSPTQDPIPSPRVLLALAALLAVLWFGVLGYRDLVPTDEGRYAEIPREMVQTGEWVTPRLDGFKYFEKPALQYWATAAAYEAFGLGEWQARLWTGLTGFVTIIFTWLAGRALFGARAGLYAGAILASCVYWVGLGHINTLDMGVSAFLAGSLFAFLLAQRAGATEAQTRWWMWACWAQMGFAMLSKGLIGAAFPGLTLILYTLLTRDWALWKRLQLLPGLLIFLVVAAPWYVWVQIRNPEFFNYFFIYQQFTRFLTPDLQRPGPWYYFIPILLLGILPWLGGLWPSLRYGMTHPFGPVSANRPVAPHEPLRVNWVLLIWSAFIFVFFSASHSKLPSYILPIFPALALLMGAYFAHAPQGALRRQFAFFALLSAGAVVGFTQLWRAGSATTPGTLYQQYGWWLEVTAALGLVSSLLAWHWEKAGRRAAAVLVLACGMLLGLTVASQSFQILGRTASTKDVVRAIRPWLHAGQPFYAVGTYDQTLPFYLDRTVTVVAYEGELHFGITEQPQLWVPTVADFAKRWRRDHRPLAFMPVGQLAAMRAAGLPLVVIEKTSRYAVIAKPGEDYGAAAQAAAARLPAAWNTRSAGPIQHEVTP
ncbi:MAG: glycosyltransferase family 39 protein [Betaproteobacteria bacterium]|nr:glycosyltransferase family 39 protein [Betaproteobacteria bacterium]